MSDKLVEQDKVDQHPVQQPEVQDKVDQHSVRQPQVQDKNDQAIDLRNL